MSRTNRRTRSSGDSALRGTRSQFEVATDLAGSRRYWQGRCVADIDAQGVVSCVQALLTDIAPLRKSELDRTALAPTDALSGRPNRRRLDGQRPDAIVRTMREPLRIGELTLSVTTSIGIMGLAPGGFAQAQALLDAADHALYEAKACDIGTSADAVAAIAADDGDLHEGRLSIGDPASGSVGADSCTAPGNTP